MERLLTPPESPLTDTVHPYRLIIRSPVVGPFIPFTQLLGALAVSVIINEWLLSCQLGGSPAASHRLTLYNPPISPPIIL